VSVTIYTSFGCGPCAATKSWLQKNNIPYIEKNVSDDSSARDEILNLGYRSTPVVITDIGEVIVGYSPSNLTKALL
tara:strand:+ start:477 stop:704 length:228 start_codon:yes stop_codon:yes gene_type:complete